jgi:hypothetical protein
VNRGTIATLNAGTGPGRKATIINQLRAYKDKVSGTSTGAADATLVSMPLYPITDAPVFSQFGGIVPVNFSLTITDPNGSNPNTSGDTRTIYYRLDEQDPREVGGTVRAGSLSTVPATLTASGIVKSRIYNATKNEWSALTEALFVVVFRRLPETWSSAKSITIRRARSRHPRRPLRITNSLNCGTHE